MYILTVFNTKYMYKNRIIIKYMYFSIIYLFFVDICDLKPLFLISLRSVILDFIIQLFVKG